jgi:adenosylhomocysteine nucleosidase
MTRTAIVAAMPAELRPLVRGWQRERRGNGNAGGVDLWRWRFDDGEWIAACAGAGVEAATRAFAEVERAFAEAEEADESPRFQKRNLGHPGFVDSHPNDKYKDVARVGHPGFVDLVISTGWAGALSEELGGGRSYWVSDVIDARSGERFASNLKNSERDGNSRSHPSDKNKDVARVGHPPGDLADSPPRSQNRDLGHPDLWLVTSPKVADAAEKQRLAAAYGAGLVDMEAAGIARLAQMRGIPFYCVKGISDGYRDKLPDFNRFISANGKFRLIRFILFALVRPWHWLALARMGENSRKAAESIKESILDFLDERAYIIERNGYPDLKR